MHYTLGIQKSLSPKKPVHTDRRCNETGYRKARCEWVPTTTLKV